MNFPPRLESNRIEAITERQNFSTRDLFSFFFLLRPTLRLVRWIEWNNGEGTKLGLAKSRGKVTIRKEREWDLSDGTDKWGTRRSSLTTFEARDVRKRISVWMRIKLFRTSGWKQGLYQFYNTWPYSHSIGLQPEQTLNEVWTWIVLFRMTGKIPLQWACLI